MENSTPDIISALKRNQRLLENSLYSKLLRKKIILQYLILRKVKFLEGFWNLLPDKFRIKNIPNLDEEIIPRYVLGDRIDSSINLFNKEIYYCPEGTKNKHPYLFAFMATINQIINLDQYKISELVKDGFSIIDAGCNIGVFSIFANHIFPNNNIYAFEPNNVNFQIFKKTIDANQLSTRIHCFNEALGNRKCSKNLKLSKDPLASGSAMEDSRIIQNKDYFSSSSVSVNVTTIDDFVRENNISKIDFIKIDSEGYEKNILLGAKNTIQRFHPIIVCSAYHLKDDKKEIPDLIKSFSERYQFRQDNKAEEILIAEAIRVET